MDNYDATEIAYKNGYADALASIVRCKDCKHYFYSLFSMGMKCKYDGLEWGKDDFCSKGERRQQ